MRSAPKVQILIDSLTSGGAERMVVALSGYLAGRGFGVTVVTLHGPERDFFCLAAGVDRRYFRFKAPLSLPGRVWVNIRRVLSLRRMIRADGPDVVVGVMTNCAALALLAALGLRARVLVAERNAPGRKRVSWSWVWLRKTMYRFADCQVAQTRRTAAWIRKEVGGRKISIIPNSVKWPLEESSPAQNPERWLSGEIKCVLAAGTKIEQKGFDLLVDAFSRVRCQHPEWVLVIIGIDPARADDATGNLLSRIEVAGAGESIRLPGVVGNIGDWYERADVFVLSSRHEGFPNVLLEAMAGGCACIAFDCDAGPGEIIDDGANGLLAPAEDVDALAAGMSRLMADASLRERLGAEARAVTDRYSEPRILGEWETLIRQVTGLPGLEHGSGTT